MNGIVAAPVMAIMMLMVSNRSVMGKFQITGYLRLAGWTATIVMGAATMIMFVGAFP